MKKTKVCLIEFCFSKHDLFWKNGIRLLKNLGFMGLSFMTTLSKILIQNSKYKAALEVIV